MSNVSERRYSSQKGEAALTAVIFLLFISLAIVFGLSSMALRESRIARIQYESRKSYFLAEAGAEEALVRLVSGKQLSSLEEISLAGGTASTTISDIGQDKEISSSAQAAQAVRAVKIRLSQILQPQFRYGGQVGSGGLHMQNSSKITGDVYVNGSITGNNSPLIEGNATAGGTIADPPTVSGTKTQGAPVLPMPITDSALDWWESKASAGGTYSGPCPYEPADGTMIGPLKIPCDLKITGTKTITVAGPIWVAGNVNIKNQAVLKLSSSYGTRSEVVIADDPLNRATRGKIAVENSANITGSGTSGSYLILISRNDSAENGGGEKAIEVKNSSTAALYYAPHGFVIADNNSSGVHIRSATAWKLELKNQATVEYETAISQIEITSSPWSIESWQEVP